MAGMESLISNAEFIKAVENNRISLNSAFEYFNSGNRRVDPDDVLSQFANILNPVYSDGFTLSDKEMISVFKIILKLTAKKITGEKAKDRELASHFNAIIKTHKKLLAEHGGSFIINVINALLNLSSKRNFAAGRWVSSVSSLPHNITIDEFRQYGFVLAWVCGAAGARENAAGIIGSLNPEVLKILLGINSSADIIPEKISRSIIKNPWENPELSFKEKTDSSPVFNTAGGFIGYGSEFSSLPVVAAVNEHFFATDGINVFRLHGDYYGIELVRDNSITAEMIKPGGVINRFVREKTFTFDNKDFPLPAGWKNGVSSIAFNKNTVVWTLKDSYMLYLAGIKNNA